MDVFSCRCRQQIISFNLQQLTRRIIMVSTPVYSSDIATSSLRYRKDTYLTINPSNDPNNFTTMTRVEDILEMEGLF